jgi:hypothetical protein
MKIMRDSGGGGGDGENRFKFRFKVTDCMRDDLLIL